MAIIIFFLICISRQNYAANNYVTICPRTGQFAGSQFGGQLWAVCKVLGFAWSNDLIPIFSTTMLFGAKGGELNYKHLFFRINQHFPSEIKFSEELIHIGSSRFVTYDNYWGYDVCLCGVDHEVPYFINYRDRIKEILIPSDEITQQIHAKYFDIINHPKTVAVHLRTYHPSYPMHHFLGKKYFMDAMNQFSDDHLFVIFSDRIDWCKKEFSNEKKNIVFIEGNNHIIDFFLMTYCKNIIISNSSFSWMAAFLKKDDNGLVLAPARRFPEGHIIGPEDVYFLPEWLILPLNEHQPNYDLLKYETTSIDEKGK